MDPLERAIGALRKQRAELAADTADMKDALKYAIDKDERRELKALIKRNVAAIEGFDYVLSFCVNLKEEVCLG